MLCSRGLSRSSSLSLLFVGSLLVALPGRAAAQAGDASIIGVVTDESGAVLASRSALRVPRCRYNRCLT